MGLAFLLSGNADTNNNSDTDNLPDPAVVNSPQEAIPEDMKIKNDSVAIS